VIPLGHVQQFQAASGLGQGAEAGDELAETAAVDVGRMTISADGKTRTLVTTGTGADGKPVNSTAVYERQ